MSQFFVPFRENTPNQILRFVDIPVDGELASVIVEHVRKKTLYGRCDALDGVRIDISLLGLVPASGEVEHIVTVIKDAIGQVASKPTDHPATKEDGK